MGFFPFLFSCYSLALRSTLLIKDHAYSPRRVLRRYNSSPQVQLSGAFHFFSSPSPLLPFPHLPVRSFSWLLFMYFPLSTPLDPPHLLPSTFTKLPLLWRCKMYCLLLNHPFVLPSICICNCLFWSCGPQQISNINEDPHEFLSSN